VTATASLVVWLWTTTPSALAPLAFGYLLDHGQGAGVFYGASMAWLVTIGTIYLMKSSAVVQGKG
jgi:hypothetical protein